MPQGYNTSRKQPTFPLTFTTSTTGTVPASGGGVTNFLRADQTWATPPGTAGSANPTAQVGLSAVNGTATTFMTSDSAPALSQAIVPNWTGSHTFTSSGPQITLGSTSSGHFGQINLSGSTSGLSQIFVTSTGNMNITCQAGGGFAVADGSNGEMFGAINANSGVAIANFVLVLGNSTGNAPILRAQGTDTNINLALTAKGTGTVQFANSGSFSADGTVATVLGSLGPTGSHTTVQTWLTIIDNTGATRYIPCF